MKVSKNALSMLALAAFVVTLAMPFASEAKKKHHGKKASHSASHKKSKKSAQSAPAAAPAEAAPAAPAAPAGGAGQ